MKPLIRNSPGPLSAAVRALAVLLLGLPVATGAQEAPSTAGSWRIEPTIGVWHQGSAQPEATSSRYPRVVGPVVGFAVSQQRGAGVRLSLGVVYHRIDDAAERTLYGPTGQPRMYTYDRDFIALTAGASSDLWQGRAAAVGIGIEVGPAWNREVLDRASGPSIAPFPEPSRGGDWRLAGVIVPSLAARRAVGPRLEVTTTARLLLGVGDIQPSIPAITIGTTYRL